MPSDPRDVFDFRQVNEGPVKPQLVPGFGGVSEVVRVVDDTRPGVWVDVLITGDGVYSCWGRCEAFDSDEQAIEWATTP